jgi:hypothetical protein
MHVLHFVITFAYIHIILPVVLYECETWYLMLTEEHRLRVFDNREKRNVCRRTRDEVTGEWRRLHNEKLNELYSSPNIIRVMKSRITRWTGHISRIGERKWAYRVLAGGSEGRRPLGKQRRRWEDNTKMDLQEAGWGGHGLD